VFVRHPQFHYRRVTNSLLNLGQIQTNLAASFTENRDPDSSRISS
jgi:hypothetical protein